ncbi:MAG: DUF4124 domain-containing protein [Gammaproteobacteria bacterium]|nr:DUF4124 domain-containing protein [Gammaproteobacteria bacterium]
MKFKILSMLIILGVISVLPMIYTGKFDPLVFITGFSDESSGFTKLKAKAPENLSNVVTDEKVQVYKWSDKNGVMQFSNRPPLTVTNAEQVVLDPNSNLVQAVKIPEKEEPKQVVQTESPNPYSVKGMKKVMDDARGVEEMLHKRHEEQQKMMNNL